MPSAQSPRGGWVWAVVFVLFLAAFYWTFGRSGDEAPDRREEAAETGGAVAPQDPPARPSQRGGSTFAGSEAPDAPASGGGAGYPQGSKDVGKRDGIADKFARALGWRGDGSRDGEAPGAGSRTGTVPLTAPGSGRGADALGRQGDSGQTPLSPNALDPETEAPGPGPSEDPRGEEPDVDTGTDDNGSGNDPGRPAPFELGEPEVVSCADQPGLCQGFSRGLALVGNVPGVIGSRVGDVRAFALLEPGGRGEVWIRSGDQVIRVDSMNLTTEGQLDQAISRIAP